MEELHNYRDCRCPNAQDRSACWEPLWSEVVYDFRGIPTTDAKVRNVPREVSGESFSNMIEDNVEEHLVA